MMSTRIAAVALAAVLAGSAPAAVVEFHDPAEALAAARERGCLVIIDFAIDN